MATDPRHPPSGAHTVGGGEGGVAKRRRSCEQIPAATGNPGEQALLEPVDRSLRRSAEGVEPRALPFGIARGLPQPAGNLALAIDRPRAVTAAAITSELRGVGPLTASVHVNGRQHVDERNPEARDGHRHRQHERERATAAHYAATGSRHERRPGRAA